ncbi:hypothetical protein NO995_16935 [Aestuariibaculum sp. M13]|nr:hypothetical protein [Aestuariibaculum sp. M13]MCR8669376.1 hypothetical protein [Aestuariibaculum sp. M13]
MGIVSLLNAFSKKINIKKYKKTFINATLPAINKQVRKEEYIMKENN